MRRLLVLITVTLSWAENLTDREVLKQELFVQKLASKLFSNKRFFLNNIIKFISLVNCLNIAMVTE